MADLTADGVPITLGLRVWTNDLRRATVTGEPRWADGWWDVTEEGHLRPSTLNGERMATRHPFTREEA